jgi:hypothetical protein
MPTEEYEAPINQAKTGVHTSSQVTFSKKPSTGVLNQDIQNVSTTIN